MAVAPDELPVFATVLQARPPQGHALAIEVGALTQALAACLDRAPQRVHVLLTGRIDAAERDEWLCALCNAALDFAWWSDNAVGRVAARIGHRRQPAALLRGLAARCSMFLTASRCRPVTRTGTTRA